MVSNKSSISLQLTFRIARTGQWYGQNACSFVHNTLQACLCSTVKLTGWGALGSQDWRPPWKPPAATVGLVHVTIVTQATIMIDAAHQTCTQRRVGEHRVSVGCTAPPTAWPAYARPSIRKLPIREIERLEPASPRSCEPGREPRRKSCEQHNSN